ILSLSSVYASSAVHLLLSLHDALPIYLHGQLRLTYLGDAIIVELAESKCLRLIAAFNEVIVILFQEFVLQLSAGCTDSDNNRLALRLLLRHINDAQIGQRISQLLRFFGINRYLVFTPVSLLCCTSQYPFLACLLQ